MSQFAHIARVSAPLKLNGRRVLVACAVAIVVGLAVSIWYTIVLGYEHGAYNFGVYTFRSGNQKIFNNLVSKMRNPFDMDWARIAFFGVGAVAAVLVVGDVYTLATDVPWLLGLDRSPLTWVIRLFSTRTRSPQFWAQSIQLVVFKVS